MDKQVEWIVALALKEDIGEGDITTEAIYKGTEYVEAEIIAKEDGIIAGIELASYIYSRLDESIVFEPNVKDGHVIHRGQLAGVAKGPANILLTGERTVLNFMQRMSGIATKTHAYVKALEGTRTQILDTRKTVPGHRYLDKWAVRLGGGTNHRMRLDDRFLIKENHISVAGSISKAIDSCIRFRELKHLRDVKIEIEVKNLDELSNVIHHGGVDYVMFDNMDVLDMQTGVRMAGGRFLTEASGNVTLDTVRDIAETGVDYISAGALTHTVKALDLSMLFAQ
jgi:nicotinate-nucleotide pyrophosphorylase (carboxylating)